MSLKILFKLVLFFLTLALTLKNLLKHFFASLRNRIHLKFLLFLFGDQHRIVANFGNSCLNKSLKNVSIVLTAPESTSHQIISRRNNNLRKLVQWLGLIGCDSVSVYSALTQLPSTVSAKSETEGSIKDYNEPERLIGSGELFTLIEHQKTELSSLKSYDEVKEYLSRNSLLGLQKENSIPQVILVFDQGLDDLNLYGFPSLLREQAQIYSMNKRLEDVGCLDFIQKLKIYSKTEIRLGK